jgi:hypothetical protein
MHIYVKIILVQILFSSIAQAQALSPEDVQDLNSKTGVGCAEKDPVSENADYYVVCKSRKSAEQAWNAALYRSKIACSSDKLSVLFNVSPSLPKENGVFGARVEVSCDKNP